MKYLLILLVALLSGCTATKCSHTEKDSPEVVLVTDTIFVPVVDNTAIDSLNNQLLILKDSINYLNTTVKLEDYLNANKLEKIKHYIYITEQNPKNRNFFFGWIKRTMAE